MKRIYRSILRELYPAEFSWRQLSPEQETRQSSARARSGAPQALARRPKQRHFQPENIQVLAAIGGDDTLHFTSRGEAGDVLAKLKL
jgi:hypothetical protein